MRPPGDDVVLQLRTKADDVRGLLAERHWRPHRLHNPELRRNLDRLYCSIQEVAKLPTPDSPVDRAALTALCDDLLGIDLHDETADSLGLRLERIDKDVAQLASTTYLAEQIAFEHSRLNTDGDRSEWSAIWGDASEQPSPALIDNTIATAELELLRRRLQIWYGRRHAIYTLERLRNATRARRLALLAICLTVVVGGTIVVATEASDTVNWRDGLLAALTGALGATVALAYRVRDTSPRLRDLRTFGSSFALQAALGALAGTLVWLLVESGLIQPGGTEQWAVTAVIAFAAGFSEPFFLNIVQGLSALDVKPTGTTTAPQDLSNGPSTGTGSSGASEAAPAPPAAE